MHELVVNLHMHTTYSDGTGSHRDIAAAALRAGLDVAIVTDHNVLVSGPEGYYKQGKQRLLLLTSEEVHDQARQPQKNHLLVLGAGRELAHLAEHPQQLINAVRAAGGLSFLAHPFEADAPLIHEPAIDWVDWDVQDYTGIELWNGLSELKEHIPTYLHALFYVFFPHFIAHGPNRATLARWDELLRAGRRIAVVGGSDAHELHTHLGPLRRTVLPYEFHFRTICTHVLTPAPLSEELDADRQMIYGALGAGHAFVGYDLDAPTRGFRFSATGREQTVIMGDEIPAEGGVTLQVRLPARAECRLIRDGALVKTWRQADICTHITTEPGAYRVEAYRSYLGRRRGWIFSNPIYVR